MVLFYIKISLGFAPSCGPINHLSSMISMILAARANPTFNFLWSSVADAFLVREMTSIACWTSSSSLPASHHENNASPVSILLSSIFTIS